MGTFETQLAVVLGLKLIERLLKNKDVDTSRLEQEIIAADSKEAIKAIAVREAVSAISKATDTDADELLEKLAATKNTEQIKEVIQSPAVKKGILENIGGLFEMIFGALFGKKE